MQIDYCEFQEYMIRLFVIGQSTYSCRYLIRFCVRSAVI